MPHLQHSLTIILLSSVGFALSASAIAANAEHRTDKLDANLSVQANTDTNTGHFTQGMKNLGSGIKSAANKAGNLVVEGTESVVTGTKNAANYTGDKAKSGWEVTKEATLTAKDKAVDTTSNLTHKAVTSGKAAAHNATQTTKSALNQAATATGNLTGKAIDSGKEAAHNASQATKEAKEDIKKKLQSEEKSNEPAEHGSPAMHIESTTDVKTH